MLVDIHSHKFPTANKYTVYNVPMEEAELFLSSDIDGYFSLGFHPWFINKFSENLYRILEIWITDERLVAIGECGFDKNSDIPYDEQLNIFERQIKLSEEIGKPVIIHCVGYYNELITLKKTWNPKQPWIVHGFRGKPQLAEQLLKSEINLSFGEKFNPESVMLAPVDKLFLETDESTATIGEIYRRIAQIKKCSVEDLNAGKALLGLSI